MIWRALFSWHHNPQSHQTQTKQTERKERQKIETEKYDSNIIAFSSIVDDDADADDA